MKLIKLNSDHYIIVDENRDIHENDYTFKNGEIREVSFLMQDNGCVITHSTQLDKGMDNVTFISLSEVKELLGEVNVEKMAIDYANTFVDDEVSTADVDFKAGYQAALEDNKGKVYKEEDIIKVVRLSLEDAEKSVLWSKEYPQKLADRILESLQPPTSWDVEFVNGKIKLK